VAATWYVGALLVSVVATLSAAWGTWRNRDQAGARPLVVVLVGATLWSGCTLATQVVSTPAVDLALNKLLYVGIVVVVNGYVLFALSFVGRGDLLTTRTLAVLAVEPGVLLGFLVHDPTGGALIRETLVDGGVSTSGPLFLAHAVYSYVLIGVTTALLVRAAVQNRGLYMWQFSALLVGVAAPWISNALFLADVVPVDLTPIAFSVTGVVLFLAIQRAGLMDVAPVARDVVVDTIDTAMIVVDDQRRVVDFNTAFATHFDAVTIGESVATALSAYPEIRAAIDDDADGEIVSVSTPTGQRHLEVTVSPVTDHRGMAVGSVVLMHDVTDQQRQQRELKRQNEQLDQFASLVSHDLRNPLNVAVGRTELAQQTGDLSHLDDVQAAHDRMERLIDDVLALARQGQTLDETAPVSLSSAAATAWHNVETAAATLEIDADATIVADEGRLERLFENLFRNAVEHASSDVAVNVGVADDGFYVEDDGPGIPEDEREAVFDAGYTNAADGTGFGLAIVEEIAQAHGWTVEVADDEDGRGGARFVFRGVERVTEQPSVTATTSDAP
jgi:signal transduction histidine kinase